MSTFVVTIFGTEITVSRVMLSIGNFDIYWYGALIALGFLGALIYAFKRAKQFNIPEDKFTDVIICGTLCAILGARTYYVAMRWGQYNSFWSMIDIRDGGLAIYGGLIGALIGAAVMCRIRKINVLSVFDLAGIGFLFGQAVGRWGNFINQEAFGINTTLPWGMYSEQTKSYLSGVKTSLASQGVTVDPSLPVHPCFLYESIWCIIGFILLHFLSKKRRFKGETFLMYSVWYGLGRFLIEGIRTDSLMIGSVRVSQLVAAVCVVAGTVLLLIFRRKYRPDTGTFQSVIAGADEYTLFEEDEDDSNNH